MKTIPIITSLILLISLGGCAFDIVHVKQIPTHLSSDPQCDKVFTLTQDVTVRPSGGYSRTLRNGTKWICVGEIPQGYVYKTKDQILTIEGSNVFEVYIVVSTNKLVGFFLPVEETFSPLSPPIELTTK